MPFSYPVHPKKSFRPRHEFHIHHRSRLRIPHASRTADSRFSNRGSAHGQKPVKSWKKQAIFPISIKPGKRWTESFRTYQTNSCHIRQYCLNKPGLPRQMGSLVADTSLLCQRGQLGCLFPCSADRSYSPYWLPFAQCLGHISKTIFLTTSHQQNIRCIRQFIYRGVISNFFLGFRTLPQRNIRHCACVSTKTHPVYFPYPGKATGKDPDFRRQCYQS